MLTKETQEPEYTASLKDFILYFLYLGATGYGGPPVLVSHMERDLVEKRKWISLSVYLEGLALAQVAPGPVATQLAIYLGWHQRGVLGGLATGVAFLLPSFIIVLILAELYLRYNGFPWVQDVFYGLGAAVIAIIIRSIYNLSHKTLRTDKLLWFLAGISAAMTLYIQTGLLWMFLISGLVVMCIRSFSWGKFLSIGFLPSSLLMTGYQGKPSSQMMWDMAIFFTKAGTVVFGSGLAIMPFLQVGVVDNFHWLTQREFADAVSISMITPGPVLVIVGFIGYLIAGLMGSSLAVLAVHVPCFLIVVLAAPTYQRFAQHDTIKAFLSGIIAAVIGAIAASVVMLGKLSVTDIPTALMALIALVVLFKFKKVPELVLVVTAGCVGLILKNGI